MDFYIKTGNDPFSPRITVNTILLDNTIDAEIVGPSGIETTTTKKITNSITANFTISSKQNSLDYWISDVDYLNYVKVMFFLLETSDDVLNLTNAAKQGMAYVNLYIMTHNTKYKVLSLSEIVDLSEVSLQDYTFSTEQLIVFSEIDEEKDIILVAIPYIDFASYFSDNGLDDEIGQSLVSTFYNIETYQYNILINKNIIDDKISRVVLTDVRELKKFKSEILSLLPPPAKIPTTEDKVSYFSDVFTSFDYNKNTIKNYFFFNIKNFIEDNCGIKKIFNNLSIDELERTLVKNKSIFFQIFRNDEEESVCSFSCSLQKTKGDKNVSMINKLNNSDLVCLSFLDTFPSTKKASFFYKIKVSFSDPFVKQYYNTSTSPYSGLYFSAINDLSIIQTYVEDPRNSNSTTTKFTSPTTAPIINKNNLIINFFKIYNLFVPTKKEITKEKIQLISTALDFNKSTILVYNDFISYVTQTLSQVEQFLVSYGNSVSSYSKNSKVLNFKTNDYYFDRANTDESGYETIKFYNEVNNSSIKRYDLSSSPIDQTNEITYKIINSVLNLSDGQYSYLPNNECISNLLELEGTIVYKNNEKAKIQSSTQAIDIFGSSNTNNETIGRVRVSELNSKKQYNLSKQQIENSQLKNIIINFKDAMIKFQLYFLDEMRNEFLIPKITTVVYNVKTKQWINLSSINKRKTSSTYLAKTIYKVENNKKNIYSYNGVVPPINEEYFVLQITNGNVKPVINTSDSSAPSSL